MVAMTGIRMPCSPGARRIEKERRERRERTERVNHYELQEARRTRKNTQTSRHIYMFNHVGPTINHGLFKPQDLTFTK
jgi:hypothetical protein